MSRIGKLPVTIPDGIQVELQGSTLTVKGPKGELRHEIHPDMKVTVESGVVRVERPTDNRYHRALHGLTRSLIQNMVVGLKTGFQKKLEIIGVGFRAEIRSRTLVMQLGFSHPIHFIPPDGIVLEAPVPTTILVKGYDKHLVGQVATKIRSFRPPESYKGKGIRFEGEFVRKKAGKTTA
ncbi:MAG: 50S ribosomal protein L6 [bacterium]|nr:50S ribosomal protein L6 [bacterium]